MKQSLADLGQDLDVGFQTGSDDKRVDVRTGAQPTKAVAALGQNTEGGRPARTEGGLQFGQTAAQIFVGGLGQAAAAIQGPEVPALKLPGERFAGGCVGLGRIHTPGACRHAG